VNKGMENLKESDDMVLLIEQHKREIWEWKQKESQWIRDKNQLDGNKRIVEELSTKIIESGKRIKEVEEENLRLIKKTQEAIGEMTIVKGIGMNSPEMRAAKDKIVELEATLASAQDINENHQRYNGKLQTRLTEVEEDNKKLAQQIEDLIESRRPF
jgi:DnaJ-class molecular chaperone